LDLYLANDANWNKLFHNQGTPGNHWLQVDLRGVESNSHGVGARLRLVAGNVAQTREVGCETGSASQNSPTVHFGLGAAATVDALEVHWPSGIVQILTPGFAADRRIVVTESEDPSSVPESLTG